MFLNGDNVYEILNVDEVNYLKKIFVKVIKLVKVEGLWRVVIQKIIELEVVCFVFMGVVYRGNVIGGLVNGFNLKKKFWYYIKGQ